MDRLISLFCSASQRSQKDMNNVSHVSRLCSPTSHAHAAGARLTPVG
uniref:Uncharacterized protein n=1 Tax=Arundo donax TaxID=35708 RepID=A0A0A9C0S2_ARUDO